VLDRLAQEDADNLTVLSEDLLQFLKKWWLNHILTIDKKYVPFLKEK
jgi:hemerythrin